MPRNPDPPLLKLIANQLNASVESRDEYAQRKQPWRRHLVELQAAFSFQPFTTSPTVRSAKRVHSAFSYNGADAVVPATIPLGADRACDGVITRRAGIP